MTFQQPVPQSDNGAQGPFGLGTPTGPVQPARSRKQWLKYGAVALVSLFIGVGIGNSGGSAGAADEESADAKAAPRPTVTVTETAKAGKGDTAPAPTVTRTVTAKPQKTEESGPATSFSGEGEYVIGEDIKAGTYKTAGPDNQFGCYWERAKDASGEFSSIIANNNLQGPGRVTLNKGEYFKTNGCEKWKKVG
ncbi:hypothetical protein [Streptomyces sp. NPDC018610]|uniref:hypothetical protein n=1 Tax=Streptomyces sp. NPDC018610 TaxID=3365049 RepID=UPI003796DD15